MSELNETVLPSVWSVIRLELAARPGQMRSDLIARLTPAGLIRRTGEAGGPSRHVRPTLTVLEELRLIEADSEERLRLSVPDLRGSAFRAEVTRRLLCPPEGSDLWAVRPGGQQLAYEAELALAWLHLQGVEQPIGNWENAILVLDEQLGGDRALLRSDVPFNTMDRLARWVGAAAITRARTQPQQLLPDPTDLVRSLLPELMPERAIATAEFAAGAARVLPWLPNGWIGRAIAGEMSRVPDPSAGEGRLPQSLSLALLRLEAEGDLTFEPGDDPSRRTLLQFPDGETLGVARVVRR